jgi:hypothetical protein
VIVRVAHASRASSSAVRVRRRRPARLERAGLPYGQTMAPCETALLPVRKPARIARENRNYACARQLASATGESSANSPSTMGPDRSLRRPAD